MAPSASPPSASSPLSSSASSAGNEAETSGDAPLVAGVGGASAPFSSPLAAAAAFFFARFLADLESPPACSYKYK